MNERIAIAEGVAELLEAEGIDPERRFRTARIRADKSSFVRYEQFLDLVIQRQILLLVNFNADHVKTEYHWDGCKISRKFEYANPLFPINLIRFCQVLGDIELAGSFSREYLKKQQKQWQAMYHGR